MNAEIPSTGSSQAILLAGDIMKKPTMIKAGAVAADGIEPKRGAKKSDKIKRTATVRAVKPVLPPSTTPAELSTNVVTVEVPRIAPQVVPIASANKASLQLGIVPSALTISAFVAQPIKVPTVSNISTKRNVNIITKKSIEKMFANSNWKKVGAIDGGRYEPPAYFVTPQGIPTIVVRIIPIKSAPLTFIH